MLFLTQYFPPESNAPANRVYEFAKAWTEMGHQVQVLTGFPNHPNGIIPQSYRRKAFMREELDGIEVIRTLTFAAANKGRLRRMFQFFTFMLAAIIQGAFAAKRCDVVIATSPQLLVALAGYVLSVILRKPFVMEVRDIWPEAIVAVGLMKPGPVISALEVIERFLYRRAKSLVVVTNGFAEKIAAKGIDPSKIMVVPNAVDLRQFSVIEDKQAAKSQAGFSGKFLVSYIGTHGMAHNLTTIVETAERFQDQPDIHFLFAGDGAERKRIESLVLEKGLRNITMLGQQSRQLVPNLIGMSDVCLVPLRKTPLFDSTIPSKIYEIMACGVPIVISVNGEARRLVERAKAGIGIEPESVDQLEQAIRDLHASQEQRDMLGYNGARFVKAEFDRLSVASRYIRHLKRFDLVAPLAVQA
jgi:glycosyltransferase involved in cell wall biosynthesis